MLNVHTLPRLILLGASGHGRVIADIAQLMGYTDIVFLDDDPSLTACGGFPVLGPVDAARDMDGQLFVSIGSAAIRRRLMDAFSGRDFPVLIHPQAAVARSAALGPGSVVMAGAVLNPGASMGRGCILNTCASVDHDCRVGDFVHVSVGARLCGTVSVGDGAWVAPGAVIRNNTSVCGGCLIGLGAVVIRDIDEPGTYVGVPARRLRDSDV